MLQSSRQLSSLLCKKFSDNPNDTDGMRQCVLTLHGQNMQALGAAAASRPAPVYVNPPIRPPVTTNCQTWVPGQTTCTTR